MAFSEKENPWGAPILFRERVSSTMDEAKRLAASGCPSGTVVVADLQESGRGRVSGRVWSALPGESLLCTTVLRYPSPDKMPRSLTLRVGLAAAEALETAGGFPAGNILIKWPNDVLAVQEGSPPRRGRKLCGILCESDGKAVYVGTGFNVSQQAFDAELEQKATSIVRETGRTVAREALLEIFLRRLSAALSPDDLSWKDRLEARLFRRGEKVRFESGLADSGLITEGTLVGLGDEGELLIREEGAKEARAFTNGELRVYG